MAVIVLAVQACSFFTMAEARAADDVYLFGGGGETLAGRTGKEASSLYYKRNASSGCAEEENKNKFLLAETSVLSRTRSIGYPRRQPQKAGADD